MKKTKARPEVAPEANFFTTMKPIWVPQKPSHFGERFFSFCPKRNRDAAESSKLEHDFALLAKYDPSIVSLTEQPCELSAWIDGEWRRSRPDFHVLMVWGSDGFVEVKYSRELRDPTSRAHRQIACQKQSCLDDGRFHVVVTEKEIWSNPILLNSLRTLFHEYTRKYPSLLPLVEERSPQLVAMIQGHPGIRVFEVLDGCGRSMAPELARLTLMELIRMRRVNARIDVERLSPRSRLFWGRGAL